MNRSVFYYLIIVAGISTSMNACMPHRGFEKYKQTAAPDYSDEINWIALPWRKDVADSVPKGCTIPENQDEAEIDVFYIHPTAYVLGSRWNVKLTNTSINKRSERITKIQATAFNACGKVYVPRYRQAAFRAFLNEKNGPKALDLAYTDVKASFEYYMKHWNKGRPFILTGHSQGALHLERLLKELIDGTALQKRMVAAYVIGMPIKDTAFKHIPLATNAAQTHAYVTWNTFKWGAVPKASNHFIGGSCINPFTWKADTSYAAASLNHGGVPYTFKRVDAAVCDAKNNNGILWIHKPKKGGYVAVGKSYHLSDYSFFYMNIRENALLRTKTYLAK
ncbi:MAG: DUF3089 domain-containing protein [Cytophagales bacterium]|nr:DUF3089 domain-containing protein [Cytophaga sp.]